MKMLAASACAITAFLSGYAGYPSAQTVSTTAFVGVHVIPMDRDTVLRRDITPVEIRTHCFPHLCATRASPLAHIFPCQWLRHAGEESQSRDELTR